MISEDGWGLSVPDICLIVEEKLQKKPQRRKLTRLKYTTKQCTCQVKLIYLFNVQFKKIYKLRLYKVPVRTKLVFWTYPTSLM